MNNNNNNIYIDIYIYANTPLLCRCWDSPLSVSASASVGTWPIWILCFNLNSSVAVSLAFKSVVIRLINSSNWVKFLLTAGNTSATVRSTNTPPIER